VKEGADDSTHCVRLDCEPFPRSGARLQLIRDDGSHPLWAPDGRSLNFDRDRQMFQLAANALDVTTIGEPTPLPIKGLPRPNIGGSST